MQSKHNDSSGLVNFSKFEEATRLLLGLLAPWVLLLGTVQSSLMYSFLLTLEINVNVLWTVARNSAQGLNNLYLDLCFAINSRSDLTIYLTSLGLDFLICQVGNKNNNLHGLLCGLNEIMQTPAAGTALIQATPLVGVRSSEIRGKNVPPPLRFWYYVPAGKQEKLKVYLKFFLMFYMSSHRPSRNNSHKKEFTKFISFEHLTILIIWNTKIE